MKSLTWLTEEVLHSCGTRCGADTSRDSITIARRVEKEGDQFLTITLPSFCAGFERALAEGRLHSTHTPAFSWHKRGLPKFLRGFLTKIFNRHGRLLENPCVDAISCIRQICLLHKKTKRPCTSKREAAALRKYLQCENEVKDWSDNARKVGVDPTFLAVSDVVWSELLHKFPFGDLRTELRPRHGPGSTGERLFGNSKWTFADRWHKRLEEFFPVTEYAFASQRDLSPESLSRFDFVEPEDEQPVRVVFVPKTQKTPRVIAIEPICMQYIQQGLLQLLVPLIEGGRYTGGRVNFSDQSVNQKLALSASRSERLATLDMSDASDRVSSYLVYNMLRVVPNFRDHVFACRSTRAVLPTGETIQLSKFASMGSALCFPMEAMCFFIAIVSDRIRRAQVPVTSRNIRKYARDIYVYGDDIVVPSDEAPAVIESFKAYGFKVNAAKSFWTGKFRESCGVDAYAGERVTPVYCRVDAPDDRRSVDRILSWVSMANQFYMAGLWRACKSVRTHLEGILGEIPHGHDTSPGLHWTSYSKRIQGTKWNKNLMRFENRTWVPTPVREPDPLDGDQALLKCFTLIGSDSVSTDHLQRSVSRGKIALKRRWVPAH